MSEYTPDGMSNKMSGATSNVRWHVRCHIGFPDNRSEIEFEKESLSQSIWRQMLVGMPNRMPLVAYMSDAMSEKMSEIVGHNMYQIHLDKM